MHSWRAGRPSRPSTRPFASALTAGATSRSPRASARSVLGTFSRPAPEDPLSVERLSLITPAVDRDEVARRRIHRQSRLGREVAVVPLNERVDLGEVPLACDPRPVGGIGRTPRRVQLPLVLIERVFDRAQPPHPHERAAEGPHRRLRVGPEVAQALPQGLALDRALGEIRLEHPPLLTVARRLRTDRALAHDLLELARIHIVSVPTA